MSVITSMIINMCCGLEPVLRCGLEPVLPCGLEPMRRCGLEPVQPKPERELRAVHSELGQCDR